MLLSWGPLGIGPAAPQGGGLVLEPAQRGDLGFELGDGRRSRGLVQNRLLGGFGFVAGRIIEIGFVFDRPCGKACACAESGFLAALHQPFPGQARLQPFAAPLQRFVDCRRGRRKTALQDGERETDILKTPVAAFGSESFRPVHLLAHIVRDPGVQRRLGGGQRVFDGLGVAFGE